MFRGRSKLQRRDQDSGLVFSWRIPISNSMPFVTAVLLVGLFSVGIGTFVRIKIGSGEVREARRGSVVLVSEQGGGLWLERIAIEAGPFPSRWNPAADPEYSALRGQALKQAVEVGIAYEPDLVEVAYTRGEDWGSGEAGLGVMPPLPETVDSEMPEVPREAGLGVRVVRSAKGSKLQIPQLPLGAKQAAGTDGRRFLIEHDEGGRIVEVIPLAPDDTPADLTGWLSRARVLDHGGKAGWLVVESVIES